MHLTAVHVGPGPSFKKTSLCLMGLVFSWRGSNMY